MIAQVIVFLSFVLKAFHSQLVNLNFLFNLLVTY